MGSPVDKFAQDDTELNPGLAGKNFSKGRKRPIRWLGFDAVFLNFTVKRRLPDFKDFSCLVAIVSGFGQGISDGNHFIFGEAVTCKTINGLAMGIRLNIKA